MCCWMLVVGRKEGEEGRGQGRRPREEAKWWWMLVGGCCQERSDFMRGEGRDGSRRLAASTSKSNDVWGQNIARTVSNLSLGRA